MSHNQAMTVIKFLEARIAEDEVRATEAGGGSWESWNRSWDAEPRRDIASAGERIFAVPMKFDEHVARHNPARVLAECRAKRRVLESYESRREQDHLSAQAHATGLLLAIRALAAVYADHPDYQPEWAE